MIDILFVDEQVISISTALTLSVMAVMNLDTCYQGRSCSRHWYTHNWRDRSHSYYGPTHRRHFSRSQSCCHSHQNTSSSFRRHILHSSSSHNSSLYCPLATGCFCHLLYCDTSRHSHTPSHTCHFCRHHWHHSRLELVLLQQLLLQNTGNLAQKSQTMPKTLNPS